MYLTFLLRVGDRRVWKPAEAIGTSEYRVCVLSFYLDELQYLTWNSPLVSFAGLPGSELCELLTWEFKMLFLKNHIGFCMCVPVSEMGKLLNCSLDFPLSVH